MTLRSCLSAVPRKWKTPKVLLGMMAFELPLSVAVLALYGIASPDLYRTQFWQEGSDRGWNSNPNQILYAYANYQPIDAPLPWRGSTTNFNVVIAVLSVFMLLCKGIMYICGVFHPLISLFMHAGLAAIYAVSIHNQAGPDMSDPDHPQPGAPWYITKPCAAPVSSNLIGYCKQAKAAFAVTVVMCTLFVAYIILTLITLYPSKSFRSARSSKISDSESEPWEMPQVPRTPGTAGGMKSPTTPRTTAFNALSGIRKQKQPMRQASPPPVRQGNKGIQLRHHIGMGEETYKGPNHEAD